MKQEINIDTWERKEHFNLFLQCDLPFYNVNFNVQVEGFKKSCKGRGLSISNALTYITIKSLCRIENFLYRIENGKVVKYNTIDPSFACIRNGENLFRMVTVDFVDNLEQFDEIAKKAVADSSCYFDYSVLKDRTNFAFISPLPWLPFTGVDHTLALKKEDAIPRISWGKIHSNGGKTVLPYNIQVNHALVDGLHIGRFYEYLSQEINVFSGILDKGK